MVAAASGEVLFAGTAGSSGLTVSVRTGDGFDTSYLHLSALAVRTGSRVSAGDRVGAVGTTGTRSAAEPHLHFGVREAGTRHAYRDPLTLLPPAPAAPPATEPRPAPAPVPAPAPPTPTTAPAPRPAPSLAAHRARSSTAAGAPASGRAPRGAPAPRRTPTGAPAPRSAPAPNRTAGRMPTRPHSPARDLRAPATSGPHAAAPVAVAPSHTPSETTVAGPRRSATSSVLRSPLPRPRAGPTARTSAGRSPAPACSSPPASWVSPTTVARPRSEAARGWPAHCGR